MMENNIYREYAKGYLTQSPSYSLIYNHSDYISNEYEQVYFVKQIWFIVAYFLFNRY